MKVLKTILMCFFLTSCGEVANNDSEQVSIVDLKTLCNGTDDLVLIVKVVRTNNTISDAIWEENGNQFIHINGKCQFWVWGDIYPFAGLWATGSYVKTGLLSNEQGISLLEMLMFKQWKPLDKTWFAGGFQEARFEYFSENSKFSFSGHDDSKEGERRRQLSDGYRNAFSMLLDIGTPVKQEELRLFILEGADDRLSDTIIPTYYVNWDYNISVEEFAARQSPYCYGDSILLKGADATHFKKEREEWLKGSKKTSGTFIAVKGTSGEHAYFFLLRDVLPYEDETGLVSFDGVEPATKCF